MPLSHSRPSSYLLPTPSAMPSSLQNMCCFIRREHRGVGSPARYAPHHSHSHPRLLHPLLLPKFRVAPESALRSLQDCPNRDFHHRQRYRLQKSTGRTEWLGLPASWKQGRASCSDLYHLQLPRLGECELCMFSSGSRRGLGGMERRWSSFSPGWWGIEGR